MIQTFINTALAAMMLAFWIMLILSISDFKKCPACWLWKLAGITVYTIGGVNLIWPFTSVWLSLVLFILFFIQNRMVVKRWFAGQVIKRGWAQTMIDEHLRKEQNEQDK